MGSIMPHLTATVRGTTLWAILAIAAGVPLTVAHYQAAQDQPSLHEAVERSDAAAVAQAPATDPDAPGDTGWTPLMRAALFAPPAVVQALIDRGADVNFIPPGARSTPLYIAAQHGREDIVRLLLARGADASTTDANGRDALHAAAYLGGNPGCVRALLDAGANPRHPYPTGHTPLTLALEQRHWSCALTLTLHLSQPTPRSLEH